LILVRLRETWDARKVIVVLSGRMDPASPVSARAT